MKVAFVRGGLHKEPVGPPHAGEGQPEIDLVGDDYASRNHHNRGGHPFARLVGCVVSRTLTDLPWGVRIVAVPMLVPDSHIVGQVHSKGRLLLIDDPASFFDGWSDNLFNEPLVDLQQFWKVWRIVVGLVEPSGLIILEVDEMRFARSFHQLVQSREIFCVEDLVVQDGEEVVALGVEAQKLFLL